jgi:Flp pilus assembly pilin Flp
MIRGEVATPAPPSASHEQLMTKILAGTKKFFAGTEAASVTEYAVALMLIAVVTLVAVALLGNAISSFFVSAASTV